jgi:hypothetical protein
MGQHSAPKKTARRRTFAVAAGLATFSVIGAFAATLGGITSDQLGADASVVTSCDSDGVTVIYNTSYDGADDRYEVDSVTIGSIDAACVGQVLSVTLANGTTNLAETDQTVAGATETVPFTPTPDAEDVTNTAIVITG